MRPANRPAARDFARALPSFFFWPPRLFKAPTMHPHDVLGVRPNAGADEIELAYRSRRAQYHPDKYTNADPATVGWATGKMQEVNAAYEALKAGGAPQHRADAQASAPRPIMTLATYLGHTSLGLTQTDAAYFAPGIPSDKLHNAIGAYAPAVAAQDVVVLVDETFWGSGKEGLLITKDHIYLSPKLSAARKIALDAVQSISGEGRQLLINGAVVGRFSKLELMVGAAMLAAVDAYLQFRRAVIGGPPRRIALPPDVTEQLRAFLARFVKPRFFDNASPESRKRERTVGYLLGHEVDPRQLELVRFKLNLAKDEQLLGLSSLGINSEDQFFCVTTCGVHSVRSGRPQVFVGHEALRATAVAESIEESIFKGVQLASGERVLVSRTNVAIRPYAAELFTGLIAILNGRGVPGLHDEAEMRQEPQTDRSAIFGIAKERLLSLCELIEPLEADVGHELIDRGRGAQYFEVLEAALDHAETSQLAFLELGQIAVLCQAVESCARASEEDVPEILLVERDEDSQLVDELRTLLAMLVQARQELALQGRARDFFKR